jgi:hypothetical protein
MRWSSKICGSHGMGLVWAGCWRLCIAFLQIVDNIAVSQEQLASISMKFPRWHFGSSAINSRLSKETHERLQSKVLIKLSCIERPPTQR